MILTDQSISYYSEAIHRLHRLQFINTPRAHLSRCDTRFIAGNYLVKSIIRDHNIQQPWLPKTSYWSSFLCNKKKFCNPPSPLDAEEPSATLLLPYNSSLKQFQRIMKSSLNINLVFKYNNTVARSLIKNSPAPLEAERGVYSVPVWNAQINFMERL